MGQEKDFGLTEEEAKKTKDITPTFNLGDLNVGESAHFTILSEKPKELEIPDKEETKKQGKPIKKKVKALKALDKLTGMEVTLWLSAKSLSMGFFNVFKKEGTLKDKDVVIAVREYDHPVYDKTRAYSVQLENKQ